MNLLELKKSLVDNFDASWHAITRMVQRDIEKDSIINTINNGRIIYCLDDVIKFTKENLTVVVNKKTAKIITAMVLGGKTGKPSRARRNRIARKKTRSWKRKL